MGLPNELVKSCDADHAGIVRFDDCESQRYEPVWKSIEEMVGEIRLERVNTKAQSPPAPASVPEHDSGLQPSPRPSSQERIESGPEHSAAIANAVVSVYVNAAAAPFVESTNTEHRSLGGPSSPPSAHQDPTQHEHIKSQTVLSLAEIGTPRNDGFETSTGLPSHSQHLINSFEESQRLSQEDRGGTRSRNSPKIGLKKASKTQLFEAVNAQNVEMVKALLECGLNPSVNNQNGETPLLLASKNGHISLAELLLNKGADVRTTFGDSSSALHLSAKRGDTILGSLLMKHGAKSAAMDDNGLTPLHIAAREGFDDFLQMMVEYESDIDTSPIDDYGISPMHDAASNGYEKVVRILLKSGAPPSIQDYGGVTPLHLAAGNGHKTVVRLLLIAEVSVQSKTTMASYRFTGPLKRGPKMPSLNYWKPRTRRLFQPPTPEMKMELQPCIWLRAKGSLRW